METVTGKLNSVAKLTTIRRWDFDTRLREIQNLAGSTVVSSHNYVYDAVNRRTRATLTLALTKVRPLVLI